MENLTEYKIKTRRYDHFRLTEKWEICLPKRWEISLPHYWEMSLPQRWEKSLTFTRLRIDNGDIFLVPENPEFHPIRVKELRILGRVIGVLRKY
jgi:hypothetical protein